MNGKNTQIQETELFLTNQANNKLSKANNRKWTKKKICLICCLSCVLLVLLVICGGLVFIFTMKSRGGGDTGYWESILAADTVDPAQVVISGSYELVAFDEQYEKYLTSMGIPFFVVPLILSASEKIEIEMIEGEDPRLVMTTITDWMTRTSEFKFNEEFSMTYGKGSMEGLMYNLCSRPRHNVIHCSSEEREKKWNFESDILFTPLGMINTRTFLTNNIVTKKYYKKDGVVLDLSNVRSMGEEDQQVDEQWLEDDDGWLES